LAAGEPRAGGTPPGELPVAGPRPADATEEIPAVASDVGRGGRLGSRRAKRLLVAGVAVVLAAGAGIGVWLGTGGTTGPGLRVTTQVVTATTGTMKQTVSASGTVEPANEADLDFAVSGKVTAVDVAVGQTVAAGQVLATVDPSALQATVDSAQASLTAAQAELSADEAAGASTSQILADKASVTSAQSQLATAEANLADASLTSTIAGKVASVDLSVGQQVSGSGSGSPSGSPSGSTSTSTSTSGNPGGSTGSNPSSSSSAQVVVVSSDSFKVSTSVDDTQVGQVQDGDQAVITLGGSGGSGGTGGFPGSLQKAVTSRTGSTGTGSTGSGSTGTGAASTSGQYYGTVSSVGLIASSSSGVASFPVVVGVTGTPSGLYAGASATLSITVKELTTVVEVPTAAISYAGGRAQVTVVTGGRHVTRDVTTGQVSTGETQITSGLKAGERVLERVVTFTGGSSSGSHSLLGRSGTTTGGFPSGGFPVRRFVGGGPPGAGSGGG
jgi:macrolide-specific efflux system membrane fusion protein